MRKKSFLYGAMLLTLSAIVSKILGAVYRIPLTHLLGSEGIGIFQMIFPVYSLLLVLSSSGIPVCVSRFVSGEVAHGRTSNLKSILKNALLLSVFISAIFTLFVIIFANYIATLQGNTMATIGYFAVAPAILLGSIVAVLRGYFEGLQDMKPTAFSEVVEQVAKVGLGLIFALLLNDYGLEYGVMGAVLGITLGEVISIMVLFVLYKLNVKKQVEIVNENKIDENLVFETKLNTETNFQKGFLKKLFLESLPITIGAMIVPLTLFLDSILIINILTGLGFSTTTATRLFGLQAGVVASLIQLPTMVAISISTAILPNIVASKTQKNELDVSNKSSFAIKLVWIIALPCFVGLLLLAKEITLFLYGNGLTTELIPEVKIVAYLISISAIAVVYHSLVRIFISLLHAVHKSRLVAKNLLIASVIKVLLTLVLVSIASINIYGASLASTISYSAACILLFMSIQKHITLSFQKKQLLYAPFLSAILLTLVVLLFKYVKLDFIPQNITTLTAVVLGASVYVAGLFLLKAFDKKELKVLNIFMKRSKK